MGKLDAIGRGTFHHIASQDAVRPTNREIRWIKLIESHGPQSSVYLHELTRDTHRCKDTALRQMQHLRAGGYLSLPPQQRATERAEFNPYIYDLTPKAHRFLADHGLAEATVRPAGPWWHGYHVACVTSSIEMSAARDGVRLIPAHAILKRNAPGLAIPMGDKRLIPDQLFALDYGGSYRAFVLEVDRGTEPMASTAFRKSLLASIDAYAQAQKADKLRMAYSLRTPVLILWVFTARARAEFLLRHLLTMPANLSAAHLVMVDAGRLPEPSVPERYFRSLWQRAEMGPVTLSDR